MIINDFYESYVITKNYESRKKFRFLLELNEKTNEGGRFSTDFVRHFWMQWCSTYLSKISIKFTYKPPFSSGLSVNFWTLCWWFTDKSRFLEHLSVKPGSKRLKFYGQPAVFSYFVRNRHFSSKSFTDRRPIFIDVSVNVSDFVKCAQTGFDDEQRNAITIPVLVQSHAKTDRINLPAPIDASR